MYYIGLMSGTSMDAVDAAVVQINEKSLNLIAYNQFPYHEEVRNPVRNLTAQSSQVEIDRYHTILGDLFSDAVEEIIKQSGIEKNNIRAVGSHGQTILHLPDADSPVTLQIGDAAIIARRTGITTVADFRRKDMEAGGQGAPLAPALHACLFRSASVDRCILNLGGIANITILPAVQETDITGFDTGPGNGLLDDWNWLHNKTTMDKDGNWARSGTADKILLELLLSDPYFKKPVPKSTGRDYFNLQWLNRHITVLGKDFRPEDVQATLLLVTVNSIVYAINNCGSDISELYICGGGIHNPVIIDQLRKHLPGLIVTSTQKLGMDPDAVEAVTFAWLAKRRLDGLPGNLPSVTGAKKPVLLGTIYKPPTGAS